MPSTTDTPDERPADPGPTPGPTLAGAVRRYPALVIAGAVLLAVVGVVIGIARSPTYTASMELNVGVPDAASQATPGYLQAATTLAQSYAREAASALVFVPVARRTRLPLTAVQSRVSASVIPNSTTFYVHGTGSSAGAAVALTNIAGEALQSAINGSQAQQGPAKLLAGYRTLQQQADSLNAYAGYLQSRENAGAAGVTGTQVAAARLRAQTAQLQAQAQAERYSGVIANGTQITNVAILNRADSASGNRATITERYGIVGVLAGLVLGALLAFGLARRRARRSVG